MFEGESTCVVMTTAGIKYANATHTHISAPAHSWARRGQRLHNWPPEQEARHQKTEILQVVHPQGTHAHLKSDRKMPSDYGSRAGQPTRDRIFKALFEPSCTRTGKPGMCLNKQLRKPAHQRKYRSAG